MDLFVLCYQMTKDFPKSEIYGLVSQMQRVAVSIPANIGQMLNGLRRSLQSPGISFQESRKIPDNWQPTTDEYLAADP